MQCRCIIRGSINNDEYFHVKSIARPGETISSHSYEQRVGGKGANQAVAITRAGGVAEFYGVIGKDGLWVKSRVQEFGLDDGHIIISDEDPIGRALIQVSDSGENSIILFPGANHSKLHEDRWLSPSDSPYTSPLCTHLLLQNEIHPESTLYALNSCPSDARVVIIFNPSPMLSEEEIRRFPWGKIDWLIVNQGEAEDLYNTLLNNEHEHIPAAPITNLLQPEVESELDLDLRRPRALLVGLSLMKSLARTNIVCTLGERGVLAFVHAFHSRSTPSSSSSSSSELLMYVPAAKLKAVVTDTTGAGDCFTGYFVAGLMEFKSGGVGNEREMKEADLEGILKRCVEAAGMCVERPGTIDSIPTIAEVRQRMSSF